MKHPVATLEGALLDAAVALAERKPWRIHDGHGCLIAFSPGPLCRRDRDFDTLWKPSTEWHDGGPIVERERITIIAPDERPDQLANPLVGWTAAKYVVDDAENETEFEQNGPTLLVAAMRAYVMSRFGAEVELP